MDVQQAEPILNIFNAASVKLNYFVNELFQENLRWLQEIQEVAEAAFGRWVYLLCILFGFFLRKECKFLVRKLVHKFHVQYEEDGRPCLVGSIWIKQLSNQAACLSMYHFLVLIRRNNFENKSRINPSVLITLNKSFLNHSFYPLPLNMNY